ncbi:hypothetical protein E4U42_005059, partial [Claviceps africana]
IPRFPDSQIPRFPDSQIPRFPDSQIPRFPDSQIPRFPDSRIPCPHLLRGVRPLPIAEETRPDMDRAAVGFLKMMQISQDRLLGRQPLWASQLRSSSQRSNARPRLIGPRHGRRHG